MKAIRSWWGQRFIAALEAFTDQARLARGRGYANGDRVKSWKLVTGGIDATIRGNTNPYYGIHEEPTYQTRIALKPITAGDWALLIRHLGSRAAFIARLLRNEVPDNIEKPFQALDLNLLPHRAKDLETRCSCPDYYNPCKHVAGLCYVVAAELDRDPFLLFELRGLAREDLFRQLRETPLGKILVEHLDAQGEPPVTLCDSYFTEPRPNDPLEPADAASFWLGRKRLPDELSTTSTPSISGLLAKKGGAFPEFWTQDTPFTEIMEALYEAVRKRAKDW
ncbi:MAG: SWIM zinc finger family protein [Methylotetracoccus sp.]